MLCFTLRSYVFLFILFLIFIIFFPVAVILGIFNVVTRKLGMLAFIEVDHEFVICIATSEVSAAFTLTDSSSLSLSCKAAFSTDRLLLWTCNQSKGERLNVLPAPFQSF